MTWDTHSADIRATHDELDKHKGQGYVLTYVDTTTYVVRVFSYPLPWDDHSWYLHFEGNWSCDCNRVRAFYSIDEEPDPPCGESHYSLVAITFADGTRVDVTNTDRKLLHDCP